MGRQIAITEFKAHLLRLADEVAESGETIVVTRRGRPLLRVTPAVPPPALAGSVEVLVSRDELLAPLADEWDAVH